MLKVYNLITPIKDNDIEKINAGEFISITGEIFFARDEAHKRALEYKENKLTIPFNFQGGVLYHAGPIAKKIGDEWKIIAAGPTTSTRMEMFEPKFIKEFKIKIILGKGGMKGETLEAFKKYKVIYGAVIGGTALLWANKIEKVLDVKWLDLGIPEALWKVKVKNFGPILVAIDSKGKNLYDDVDRKVVKNKIEVLKKLQN